MNWWICRKAKSVYSWERERKKDNQTFNHIAKKVWLKIIYSKKMNDDYKIDVNHSCFSHKHASISVEKPEYFDSVKCWMFVHYRILYDEAKQIICGYRRGMHIGSISSQFSLNQSTWNDYTVRYESQNHMVFVRSNWNSGKKYVRYIEMLRMIFFSFVVFKIHVIKMNEKQAVKTKSVWI